MRFNRGVWKGYSLGEVYFLLARALPTKAIHLLFLLIWELMPQSPTNMIIGGLRSTLRIFLISNITTLRATSSCLKHRWLSWEAFQWSFDLYLARVSTMTYKTLRNFVFGKNRRAKDKSNRMAAKANASKYWIRKQIRYVLCELINIIAWNALGVRFLSAYLSEQWTVLFYE